MGMAGGPGNYSPRIANDSPPGQSTRQPGGYGGFGGPDEYDAGFPSGSPKKQAPSLMDRLGSFGMERSGTLAPNTGSGYGSMRAPRAPRKNGYGGFGPPERAPEDFEPAPFGTNNRSKTFPRPSEAMDAPARTPSAPGFRPDRTRRPSRDPDLSMAPPSRASPMRRGGGGARRDPNVPAPSINLAEEFGVGNPYHVPSDSTSSSSSSGYSQSDAYSQPSSRSSPPRSAGSGAERKASDTSKIDNLMSDLQSSMNEFQSGGAKSPTTGRPLFKNSFSLSQRPLPPDRGYDPRIDPGVQNSRSQQSRSPLASPMGSPSFLDPAIQDTRRELPPSPGFGGPRSPRFPSSDAPPASPDRNTTWPRVRSRSRSRSRDPAALPASRGDCKACGLAIRGKSISSADGRLTGRYHKACFVCTTCNEPFSSSTFYVLDDKPYCEQHYHELNGSLCGSCGNGIEGQYLEDESSKKYHVGCFRCGDCGKVLRDGYFEVNGKAFCEKDAWSRVQPPLPVSSGPSRQGSPSLGSGFGGPGGPGGPVGPGPVGIGGLGGPGFGPGRGRGLPAGPGGPRVGLPNSRLGTASRPKMEKRMTRLGMM